MAGGDELHLGEQPDPLVLLGEVDADVSAAADLGDDADGGVAHRAPLVLGHGHARLHPHAVANFDLRGKTE